MATYLVAAVILILLVRAAVYLVQQVRGGRAPAIRFDRGATGSYIACFFAGVLMTNAVPHFVHGVSGQDFPAPFAHLLGPGFPSHASNVLWGSLNIVLGYRLLLLGKVSRDDSVRQVFFFAGVLLMALFLCYIFSHGAG